MSETKQAAGEGGWLVRHERLFWMGGWAFAGLAALAAMAAPRVWAARGLASGPHGGHPFGAQMGHDPAAAKQHAGMALEWLLRGVNASDEQKQQARRISDRLIDEVAPSLGKHHGNREAIARELAKPQIDRDAIERLRKEEIALADDASRKVSVAVVDLAEALTPEQRAEILDLVHRFHGQAAPEGH